MRQSTRQLLSSRSYTQLHISYKINPPLLPRNEEALCTFSELDVMTGRVSAAGCLSRSLPLPTFQPLWITDALLAETCRRFAHQHRRHGSNVPGPLEARRRATKRKNTSWAHSQTGIPPIEPAILFGKHFPSGWWQKTESPEKPQAKSFLPSWLLSTESSPPQEPISLTSYESSPLIVQKTRLKAGVTRCGNVQDIHRLVKELKIDLRQQPHTTTTLFRHLLKLSWSVKEIANFLTDPSLNPPTTNHHLHLLCRMREGADEQYLRDRSVIERRQRKQRLKLRSRILRPGNWALLQAALCQAAKLGLIESRELQEIITEIYGLQSEESALEVLHQNVYELLASFEQSAVFRIHDLDQSWRSRLVAQLLSEPLSATSTKLLFRLKNRDEVVCILISTLEGAFVSTAKQSPATSIVQLLLEIQKEPEIVEMLSETVLSSLRSNDMVNAKVILQALPASTLAQVLATVTTKCLLAMRSGGMDPETMSPWGRFISSLKSPNLCPWLLERPNFAMLRGKMSDQLSQRERYLAAVWMLIKTFHGNISHPSGLPSDISERLYLREDLNALFPFVPGTFNDRGISQLRLTTRSLPFEDSFFKKLSILARTKQSSEMEIESPKLIDEITTPSTQPMVAVDSPTPIQDQAVQTPQQTRDLNFSKLMNDEWYRSQRDTSPDALAELSESVNIGLAKFGELARKVINGDKHALRVVKRILKHNVSLKNSLSQSWPQRIEHRQRWDECNSQVEDSNQSDRDKDHQPKPAEALETIERLALAFALSPALVPRSALIQVYWCYIYLHRYGAPITPAISHALWHAGVVRYRGSGPSRSQVQWILKVVAEVEGKGTARMLLWNSQFRKHREDLLKSLDAVSQDQGPVLVNIPSIPTYKAVAVKDQVLTTASDELDGLDCPT